MTQEPGRSGFYFGGHMGYLFGNGTATLADPIGVQSAGGTSPYGTFYGGVHAGYEQHFASRLMLGLELDMSFANYSDLANVLSYRAKVPARPTSSSNISRACAVAPATIWDRGLRS